MKYLKSAFSKVHAVLALFVGFNIILGLALTFGIPFFNTAAMLHFFAGIIFLITPLLLLTFMKDFKMGMTGFKGRLYIKRNDLKNKPLFAAKIISWIFLIGLILYAVSGIIIKSGLAALILPDTNLLRIHAKGVYIIPPLLILHVVLMLFAYRKTKKKLKKTL